MKLAALRLGSISRGKSPFGKCGPLLQRIHYFGSSPFMARCEASKFYVG